MSFDEMEQAVDAGRGGELQFRDLILIAGGHVAFQLLWAGHELGLFSLLSRTPGLTLDEIAGRLSLQRQPARILLVGPGGRLRLLRSADDLEDFAAEVPPDAGTLLAFRRSANSFHGHRPFTGERRSIQVNWVRDAGVVRREQARHRLSARLKRLNPFS